MKVKLLGSASLGEPVPSIISVTLPPNREDVSSAPPIRYQRTGGPFTLCHNLSHVHAFAQWSFPWNCPTSCYCKCLDQGQCVWLPLHWGMGLGCWLEGSTKGISVVMKMISILIERYLHGCKHLSKFSELYHNLCILFKLFILVGNKKKFHSKFHFL